MENYGVIELSKDQMILICGGKPLSYYIGLGIGFICGTAVSLTAGLIDGFTGKEKKD